MSARTQFPTARRSTCRRLAYSFADADYGITTYGSVILIDRRGKIAGELEESEAGLTLLKKLLADKSSGTARQNRQTRGRRSSTPRPSLCPKTGQPDFGTLTISYVPDRLCFELKSLKLYLQQYRNHGAFYEDVTNRILDDLVAAVKPRSMNITAAFTPRGGIRTNVHVEFGRG